MRKLPVIIAAACTLAAVPALAQSNSQAPSGEHYGGMRGSIEGGPGGHRSYGEADNYHRRGERGWRAMQEGCKYITVRQRQGDEVTIRHFKRCD